MNEQPSYLIAISGGSGSGKSTIAEALLEYIGPDRAVIFREDGYYFPLGKFPEYVAGDDESRAAFIREMNYDDPATKENDLLIRQLKALKSGLPINQPCYDFETHDRITDRTEHLEPRDVIIYEGIHSLGFSELTDDIDLSIYVDTPDDLRLARRFQRDTSPREEGGRGRDPADVVRQYLGTVRKSHYMFTYPFKFTADLVIADEGLPAYGGVRPSKTAIERMTASILNRLRVDNVIS